MAKEPQKLTEDELKQIIQLEIVSNTAEVAEGIFKKLFKDVKGEIDGRISRLIYGGIIATILLFIALIVSIVIFMGSYQQNYLDTQASFTQQINDLRKENSDLQIRLSNDIEGVKEKQNYLERLLLNKNGE